MAKIGVLSAMPVEIESIIQKCGAKPLATPHFYKIWEGTFSENRVFFACSGIGKVNAAATAQHLIDAFQVDCIINMGIAGGIAKDLHTLDVVIGDEVFYHDFNPASLLQKYYPFHEQFTCDKRLIEIAQSVCEATPEVEHFRVGHIASGDCFVEAGETKSRIREELGGVCCEMEGAAIGHVCFLNEVPFLIVRTISDLADEAAPMAYAEFEKKASIQSNHVVEGILNAI
ncbi:MAG: 5'-methylthioadenosine/adenosylhomocysteine nucleosidase [Ethanoligenens sp.]